MTRITVFTASHGKHNTQSEGWSYNFETQLCIRVLTATTFRRAYSHTILLCTWNHTVLHYIISLGVSKVPNFRVLNGLFVGRNFVITWGNESESYLDIVVPKNFPWAHYFLRSVHDMNSVFHKNVANPNVF